MIVANSQGEAFVDFLEGANLAIVNGRKGRDAFTCISGRGCLVVDYCIVGMECLDMIEGFNVTILSQSSGKMRCKEVAMRVPDHSLLQWEIVRDGVREVRMEEEPPEMGKRYVVPDTT